MFLLTTLDVTSLFTSIPKDLIMDSIKSRWQKITAHCKIPWEEMKIAINLLIESTMFQFDNKFYQQIEGTPMGSPVSPVFAEFVMRDLEASCLSQLDFSPIVYCRYVDDIFCILPSNQVEVIINNFNNYHTSLKFTHEMENNRSISFLDVEITRLESELLTNWYRKPTYSGRVLHFYSYNPIVQKEAIISNMVDKAILLSNERFHPDNIRLIRRILENNCYPLTFIDNNIKRRVKFLRDKRHLTPRDDFTNNNDKVIVFPYHSILTNKLKKVFNEYGTKTVFKNNNRLDQIIKKQKDTIPTHRTHDVIYMLECEDCDAKYVGQTSRALETRIKEHKNNIKHFDRHTTISKHIVENDHNINWEHPKILEVEQHKSKRDIAEMLHIKTNSQTLNIQQDTEKLSSIYFSTLK